jgi:hypothetical protein
MARTAAEPGRLPVEGPIGPCGKARLIVEIVGAYVRAWRQLRQAPIEEAVRQLRAGNEVSPRQGRAALLEAVRLGRVVVRTLAFLPGDNRCLRRSLVLTQLLARRGISGRLVIGARTAPDFLAHAWVEHEGVPVLSPEGTSFGRLVEL